MAETSTSSNAGRLVDKPSWIEPVARFGYAAKGVVFGVVGLLAINLARGAGGDAEGAQGAITEIGQQPFGRLLLALTAVGMISYAGWRMAQAAADTEDQGDDAKGILVRIGFVISSFTYLALAFAAGRAALSGQDSSGSGDTRQQFTAEVLTQPLGQWLVGIFGAIIAGVGLYHFYRVYTANFMRSYRSGEMSPGQEKWARRIGRFGLAARGVTFCIIGWFFIQAAIQSDPSEAEGLGEALGSLLQQPFGAVLLGIVAAGFIAYAVYCWSRAAFRQY